MVKHAEKMCFKLCKFYRTGGLKWPELPAECCSCYKTSPRKGVFYIAVIIISFNCLVFVATLVACAVQGKIYENINGTLEQLKDDQESMNEYSFQTKETALVSWY